MKQKIRLYISLGLILFTKFSVAQIPENWTSKQLMQPAELAKTLKKNKEIPIIISVGPGALIPHSIAVGMVNDPKNLEKFKQELRRLTKQTKIIIYCGCCPFDHCPDVRPAIDMLKQMNFSNYKLLNLPKNFKTDWIDKGYPTEKN